MIMKDVEHKDATAFVHCNSLSVAQKCEKDNEEDCSSIEVSNAEGSKSEYCHHGQAGAILHND